MPARFIKISLLIFMLSACKAQATALAPLPEEVQSTKPAPSNTAEPLLPTAIPLTSVATDQSLPILTSMCPDAATPHVLTGQQVTVVTDNTDKLKLRSKPKISPDTVMKELDQFTQLKILEGFACVHSDETGTSYWFWKVMVIPTGEIGWVSEGDPSRYFIEKTSGLSLPSWEAACPGAPVPHIAIGQEVSVVAEDTDRLKLRSEPEISPDNVRIELGKFTPLKILDGPVCAYSDETKTSYWLWKVATLLGGQYGWVAEGNELYYFID